MIAIICVGCDKSLNYNEINNREQNNFSKAFERRRIGLKILPIIKETSEQIDIDPVEDTNSVHLHVQKLINEYLASINLPVLAQEAKNQFKNIDLHPFISNRLNNATPVQNLME